MSGALILLGFMINLCTERISIDFVQRKQVLQENDVPEPTGVTEDTTQRMQDAEGIQRIKDSKALITAHVVEVGVIVHTVILGISIGTWKEDRASLVIFTIAMAFHQFFEGIGLGAIVSAASSISRTKRAAMVAAFTLSFPLSICAGIAISFQASDLTTDELIAGRESNAVPVACQLSESVPPPLRRRRHGTPASRRATARHCASRCAAVRQRDAAGYGGRGSSWVLAAGLVQGGPADARAQRIRPPRPPPSVVDSAHPPTQIHARALTNPRTHRRRHGHGRRHGHRHPHRRRQCHTHPIVDPPATLIHQVFHLRMGESSGFSDRVRSQAPRHRHVDPPDGIAIDGHWCFRLSSLVSRVRVSLPPGRAEPKIRTQVRVESSC